MDYSFINIIKVVLLAPSSSLIEIYLFVYKYYNYKNNLKDGTQYYTFFLLFKLMKFFIVHIYLDLQK